MRQYRSRLSEVEEQKSIKSALIFGGLTILIIILSLIFGIPLFSKFINLFNKPSTQNQVNQTVTLLAPTLSTPPKYTKEQSIIIKGISTPNSLIKIFFGNSTDEVTSDGDGNFTANIGLVKGNNVIYAVTLDKNGNTSANSTSYTINYTNQTPNLTVNTPQNNQNFYGSSQQNLNIQGSTDANNNIAINDHTVVVDPTGKFSYSINLQNGDNNLKIVSTDPAGNKKEIDLKVTFNP